MTLFQKGLPPVISQKAEKEGRCAWGCYGNCIGEGGIFAQKLQKHKKITNLLDKSFAFEL